MAPNFLHGVETIEIDRGPRPIRQVKTAVVGLICTAPIFSVAAADAKVNEPVLITSDIDAAKYAGVDRAGYTGPAALDAIHDHGAGLVVMVNVFDPAVHKTTQAAAEHTLAANDTIALPHDGLSAVVVKSQDTVTTYVADTDYTLDPVEGVITRLGTGSIAAGATLSIKYDHADPSLITSGDIIGAVDGGGNRTGLQALLDAYNLFGFHPKILIAPGYSTTAAVTTELVAMAGKLRAVALVDAPIGTTVSDAIAGRGPAGAINFNTSSDRLMLCYPHLRRYDAATDTEILEPMSQRLAGVMCAKDLERGYWWSPSNTEFKGITGVERRITAGINDPTSEAGLLNEVGIATVFNAAGTGLRSWGNRSAAWPSVTHPKNFINIRRTADVLHESVEYSMLQFLDRPLDSALITDITESVNSFVRTLIMRGALIDGECTYDPAKNPATQLALGHVTFDLTFMPPTPAERITFESFIDITLLSQLGAA
jgi:phage tail sheath protein FI